MKSNSSFIKISGDLYENPDAINFIGQIAKNGYTVVCVGGGTQINTALEQRGYTLTKHGPLGRDLLTEEERLIARDVLETNKQRLEDILSKINVSATVIIPVLEIGNVMCHINGDEFIRSAYNGFDKLYILTLLERKIKKEQEFSREKFPKIEVVSI